MTLDQESSFDLGRYIKLVESFFDGLISQATFTSQALAMGADVATIETVVSNLKQMDGIEQ